MRYILSVGIIFSLAACEEARPNGWATKEVKQWANNLGAADAPTVCQEHVGGYRDLAECSVRIDDKVYHVYCEYGVGCHLAH
jgi:hypothetical protein